MQRTSPNLDLDDRGRDAPSEWQASRLHEDGQMPCGGSFALKNFFALSWLQTPSIPIIPLLMKGTASSRFA